MSDRDDRFPQGMDAPDGQDERSRGVDPSTDTGSSDGVGDGRPEGDDRAASPDASADDPRLRRLAELEDYQQRTQQFLTQVRSSFQAQQREKLRADEEARHQQVIERARDMEPDEAIQYVAREYRTEAQQRADEVKRLGEQRQYEQQSNAWRESLGAYAENRVQSLGLDEVSQRALTEALSIVGDVPTQDYAHRIGDYIEKQTTFLADQQKARIEANDLRERAGLAQQRDGRAARGADRAGSGGGRAPKSYEQSDNPMYDMIADAMAGRATA